MEKLRYIGRGMVIKLLLEDGIAEKLTYDYETKQILKEGVPMHLKIESMEFTLVHPCEVTPEVYRDACYFWAIKNTPKPPLELDLVSEKIIQYIDNKPEFTTSEIIENCLALKLVDTRTKSLEMKIAKLLKDQGYTQKRNAKYRYWSK